MNKVDRYSVELGTMFDLTTNPDVYIEWALQEDFTSKEIITVTPGQSVTLLDFTVTVPTNAAKLIKYTTSTRVMGFFLNSNNELLSSNIAYIVRPVENWVEIELPSFIYKEPER